MLFLSSGKPSIGSSGMEAKLHNSHTVFQLQVNVQTSYREKHRRNRGKISWWESRGVRRKIHKCGLKCIKKGKGKEQAVMSDGAGRWLEDVFPISLVIGVNPQTLNPEKTLESKHTHNLQTRLKVTAKVILWMQWYFFWHKRFRILWVRALPEFMTLWMRCHRRCAIAEPCYTYSQKVKSAILNRTVLHTSSIA